MSNYDVLVQPDDRYWYVQVPAIERSTQAKGLDDIEPMAKDSHHCHERRRQSGAQGDVCVAETSQTTRNRNVPAARNSKKSQRTSGCRIPTRRTGPTQRGSSRIDKSRELYWGSPTNEHFNWSTAKQSTKRQRPNRLSQQLNHAPHARTMPHRYRLRSRLSEQVHKAQTVSIPKLKSTEQNLLIPAD